MGKYERVPVAEQKELQHNPDANSVGTCSVCSAEEQLISPADEERLEFWNLAQAEVGARVEGLPSSSDEESDEDVNEVGQKAEQSQASFVSEAQAKLATEPDTSTPPANKVRRRMSSAIRENMFRSASKLSSFDGDSKTESNKHESASSPASPEWKNTQAPKTLEMATPGTVCNLLVVVLEILRVESSLTELLVADPTKRFVRIFCLNRASKWACASVRPGDIVYLSRACFRASGNHADFTRGSNFAGNSTANPQTEIIGYASNADQGIVLASFHSPETDTENLKKLSRATRSSAQPLLTQAQDVFKWAHKTFGKSLNKLHNGATISNRIANRENRVESLDTALAPGRLGDQVSVRVNIIEVFEKTTRSSQPFLLVTISDIGDDNLLNALMVWGSTASDRAIVELLNHAKGSKASCLIQNCRVGLDYFTSEYMLHANWATKFKVNTTRTEEDHSLQKLPKYFFSSIYSFLRAPAFEIGLVRLRAYMVEISRPPKVMFSCEKCNIPCPLVNSTVTCERCKNAHTFSPKDPAVPGSPEHGFLHEAVMHKIKAVPDFRGSILPFHIVFADTKYPQHTLVTNVDDSRAHELLFGLPPEAFVDENLSKEVVGILTDAPHRPYVVSFKCVRELDENGEPYRGAMVCSLLAIDFE